MAEKNTRLKDIADIVGTSTISVHRAIYGKPGISDELRARILEEVERQNYSINENASALRRTRTNVAILLPKPVNDDKFYFAPVWKSIREQIPEYEKKKMHFKLIENEKGLLGMSTALQNLFDEEDDFHGLITVCEDQESADWIRRFIKRGTKVVILSNYPAQDPDWNCIMTYQYGMGELAGNFLSCMLKDKKGKVLLLSGNDQFFSNYHQSRGFRDILNEQASSCEIDELKGFSMSDTYSELMEKLSTENYVAAVACNARLTYYLCKAVSESGLSNMLYVIGLDVFDEISQYFEDGTLTATVYQSAKERGYIALEMLCRKLAGTETEREEKEVPYFLVMKQNYKYYL